jgi:riboflavin kinase/FMN adenylyltransferase
VRAGIEDGANMDWHDGAANLGWRPTVGGKDLRLETHLFDFSGDLYGKHLRVALIERLRAEQRFDGLDALKAQIAIDCQNARQILGGG